MKTTPWIAASAVVAAMLTLPGKGPANPPDDRSAIIDALVEQGAEDLVATEVALARTLVSRSEGGDAQAERIADLQIDLLEAVIEAHQLEEEASELEGTALHAEQEVEVEQAAYEFLIEQILSSGVASYWSGP